MHINVEQEKGICKFQLMGEFTIFHAAEIRNKLMEHLSSNKEIELDLSGVSEMDTAGLQLLLAAKREGVSMEHIVRVVSHSQAALEVIDLYNMAAQFGDPLLIPAQQ